jgi:hypothetical protein
MVKICTLGQDPELLFRSVLNWHHLQLGKNKYTAVQDLSITLASFAKYLESTAQQKVFSSLQTAHLLLEDAIAASNFPVEYKLFYSALLYRLEKGKNREERWKLVLPIFLLSWVHDDVVQRLAKSFDGRLHPIAKLSKINDLFNQVKAASCRYRTRHIRKTEKKPIIPNYFTTKRINLLFKEIEQ